MKKLMNTLMVLSGSILLSGCVENTYYTSDYESTGGYETPYQANVTTNYYSRSYHSRRHGRPYNYSRNYYSNQSGSIDSGYYSSQTPPNGYYSSGSRPSTFSNSNNGGYYSSGSNGRNDNNGSNTGFSGNNSGYSSSSSHMNYRPTSDNSSGVATTGYNSSSANTNTPASSAAPSSGFSSSTSPVAPPSNPSKVNIYSGAAGIIKRVKPVETAQNNSGFSSSQTATGQIVKENISDQSVIPLGKNTPDSSGFTSSK